MILSLGLAACMTEHEPSWVTTPPPPEALPLEEPPPELRESARWTVEQAGGQLTLLDEAGQERLRWSLSLSAQRPGGPLQRWTVDRWERQGEILRGSILQDGLQLTLSWELGESVSLQAEAESEEPRRLEQLALELVLQPPGEEAWTLDRSYQWRPVSGQPSVTGRWTPQLLDLGGLVLQAQAQAAEAEALEAGGLRWTIYLDHASQHPLRRYQRCVDSMEEQPGRERLDARLWEPGESLRASLRLWPEAPRPPLLTRFPDGYRAALVFTDHADQSDAARLEALLYGQSPRVEREPGDPEEPSEARGLLGWGLTFTKSLFPLPRASFFTQVGDADYEALMAEMLAAGVELGPHSASGERDSPAETRQGLQLLEPFGARTWIDHLPLTNCEALSAQGLEPGSWDSLGPLQEAGYDYVWAGYDQALYEDLNLLQPADQGGHHPLLHPHPRLGTLWSFHSIWMALPRQRFYQRYAEDSLSRLIQERGVHIAHTYLDTWRSSEPFSSWSLLEPSPEGFTLRPEADALFGRLAAAQERGELWVTTLGALGDQLRAVRSAELSWSQGAWLLRSDHSLSAELLLPETAGSLWLDDVEQEPGASLLLQLEEGQPRRLRWQETPQEGVSLEWAAAEGGGL